MVFVSDHKNQWVLLPSRFDMGVFLVKEHDIPSIRRFTTPDSSAATDCPSESKQGGKIQIWAGSYFVLQS